jgi:monooxygenase
MTQSFDIVVVGAGIAGIDAAYHLQTRFPSKTLTILEARDSIGGTWDVFRYPGVRSDSDMYTYGFPFRPWHGSNGLQPGSAIIEYIRETAVEFGIDRKIRFRTRMERATWSRTTHRWTLDLRGPDATIFQIECGMLYMCTGFYDHSRPNVPDLAGRDRFKGVIVHNQQWPEDLDYSGKRVVVVGSGNTAVNMIPALAQKAAHVTMLQRSPSYMMSFPSHDRQAAWMSSYVPASVAFPILRWKYVLMQIGIYEYCRRFPRHARRILIDGVKKALGSTLDVDKHFQPRYMPWDEPLNGIPDDDLFEALRSGRASMVTDRIACLTEMGIELESGATLDADLIVLATGLRMRWFGGIELNVDGQRVDLGSVMVYQGFMLSDVPNFAFATGYPMASWTLRCDLTSRYVCELLEHMDRGGFTSCVARRDPEVVEKQFLTMGAGFSRRVHDGFNRGDRGGWRAPRNYVMDKLSALRVVDPALEYTRLSARDRGASARGSHAQRGPRSA